MNMNERIRHFPVSFFAVVMGLAGLTLVLERGADVLGLPPLAGQVMLGFTALVFLLLTLMFLARLALHMDAVRKDLAHPIKLSFFPAISISLILLGTATRHSLPELSFVLWSSGAALQLLLTLFVMSRWISHTHFEIQHSNPSWFIPVVGNILVPLAGVPHGQVEVSWFFFSIGLLFWLVLLTIILYRFIFHTPLPQKLLPTFFILIAPPAVGFLAWMQLAGGLDAFGRLLYYSALFTVLLLISLAPSFRRIQFFLSWWAYSFPTAAFAVATMVMYRETGYVFFELLSWLSTVVVVLIIALLLLRTLQAMARGQICVED